MIIDAFDHPDEEIVGDCDISVAPSINQTPQNMAKSRVLHRSRNRNSESWQRRLAVIGPSGSGTLPDTKRLTQGRRCVDLPALEMFARLSAKEPGLPPGAIDLTLERVDGLNIEELLDSYRESSSIVVDKPTLPNFPKKLSPHFHVKLRRNANRKPRCHRMAVLGIR